MELDGESHKQLVNDLGPAWWIDVFARSHLPKPTFKNDSKRMNPQLLV